MMISITTFPITFSTKSTIATPHLPRLLSLTHHLRLFCHLVLPDLHNFTRNCTISTMKFLLHGSHHDGKQERLEFSKCKLIFIMIAPPLIPLHHHLIDAFIVVHILLLLGGLLIRFGGGLLTLQCASFNNQPGCDRI